MRGSGRRVTIDNRQSKIVNRKGVYQCYDADGLVTGDERWRVAVAVDGSIRIDTDTTRIAPFAEPRGETMTFQLSPQLELRLLAIHALNNRRESRVELAGGSAHACWRQDEVSKTREFAWTGDCEIDYNSALFNMVTLWRTLRRSELVAGQSRAFDVVYLNPVTFEPTLMRQVYRHGGIEQHDTRFGPMNLHHYSLDFGGDGTRISHFWCDAMGVVFDFAASTGGGYRLAGVNFPELSM
jgi:hypothetical protein